MSASSESKPRLRSLSSFGDRNKSSCCRGTSARVWASIRACSGQMASRSTGTAMSASEVCNLRWLGLILIQIAIRKDGRGGQQNGGYIERRIQRIVKDKRERNGLAVRGGSDHIEIVKIREEVIERSRQRAKGAAAGQSGDVANAGREDSGDINAEGEDGRKHRR